MAPKKAPISLAAKRKQKPAQLVKSEWLSDVLGLALFIFLIGMGFFAGYVTRGREVTKLTEDLTALRESYNTCQSRLWQKQSWQQQRGCTPSKEWAQL